MRLYQRTKTLITMRILLISLILFTLSAFSQTSNSLDNQLRLKYSDNMIEYLKANKPDLYNFYLSELKSSFEFVDLKPDLKYNDLTPYDFINKQEKEAPAFSRESFSLYNYKFIRYKDKDIVYKIPGTNQGILIYSKERFTSK